MSTNYLVNLFRIKTAEAEPQVLDFECFPFKVVFDIPGNKVSITMDHQYFFYVNRAVMDKLHADIAADLKDIKYSKIDRGLSTLMQSIFLLHVRELQSTNLAFNSYVLSHFNSGQD